MSIKSILFGSICALAVGVAGPALAGAVTASADYDNVHVHDLGNASLWGLNLEGATDMADTGLAVQADGGYHRLHINGLGDGDIWDFNGSAFGLVNKGGRIGATVGYNNLSGSGNSAHITNYGLFGEWWASQDLTLAGKVGGFDGNLIGNGYYGGATGKYYVMPDADLYVALDHTHFNSNNNETDYTVGGEYLLSETTPVAVYGGYTYSNVAGAHADTFFIGLHWYCNGDSGASALVDRQRAAGTLGWDTGMTAGLAKFF